MKKSIYYTEGLLHQLKTKNTRASLWYQMLFLFMLLFINSYFGRAQCTSYTNAVPSIRLTPCTGTYNRSGVAYNPDFHIYYSVNAGNSGYTIQTYDSIGALLDTRAQGFDYRGLWWNPNRNQLEGNGYFTLGISVQDLYNTTGYPKGQVRIALPANQPDAQSCGAYDYGSNNIFYYNSGKVSIYNRKQNNLKGKLTLNGLPVALGNINSTSVIYTGCAGKEIGIYDYINLRVYLFDKITGNFSASIQLPADAPARSSYGMGYSNGFFWLFDGSSWLSYLLFAPTTSITLNASNENNGVALRWQTTNEFNSKNFVVEKSEDGINFEEITNIKAISGSKNPETYKATDNIFEGTYYYRVKQADDYGNVSYSSVATLNTSKALGISPNPARASVNLKLQSQINTKGQVHVSDITGRIVMSKTVVLTAGENIIYLDVSMLKAGVYVIKTTCNNSVETIKFVKE
ncbi:MAG TPA: T9SS type A sorting domain-containing protein [Panacibacter sp.]|nr:T9SS type A sorting domain-containing protein [Panacibacter sp.]